MSLEPEFPQRPLTWPPFVERLSQAAQHPERVYLVGGAVRDALRGRDIHDFDLASPDSGRSVARQIADRLDGKYYALDPDRDVGRAIVPVDDALVVVDVAAYRGESLLDDLQGRDFTINAMAVRLDRLDAVIDPLGGQIDLFTARVLRQCSATSVDDDPVRAIRAVRSSLQFGLRMDAPLVEAAKRSRSKLFDDTGKPMQAERVRDELFKLLDAARPADALRILDRLGLFEPLGLLPGADASTTGRRLAVAEELSDLAQVISPQRSDNTASDLILGTAVMILDRFRAGLQQHLSTAFAEERRRAALLCIAAAATPNSVDWRRWSATYCLSNPEKRLLLDLDAARGALPGIAEAADRRAVYRYFKRVGEAGVDGVLLMLAEFLAANRPTPNAIEWGDLLEHVASPLLDAFFNHYEDQISPGLLLSGDDLQRIFGLTPGSIIGRIIEGLQEEQAAGAVGTQKEALQFVKRFLEQQSGQDSRHQGPGSTTSGS